MAGYDNRLRDKQTILGFSREYHKSAPDPKKCNPKSYMELTDLINQIFSAQGMNQVNASITSSKKFAEIAIFTVSNAMGERIEPEFVEPIYNAYERVIPITPLNSKELEKFKSTQNYLYECQTQSMISMSMTMEMPNPPPVLRPVPLPTRPPSDFETRHEEEQADNAEISRVEQSHKAQLIARGKMLNETYLFQEMGYRGGFENQMSTPSGGKTVIDALSKTTRSFRQQIQDHEDHQNTVTKMVLNFLLNTNNFVLKARLKNFDGIQLTNDWKQEQSAVSQSYRLYPHFSRLLQFTENLFEAHNAKCQSQNVLTHKLVDPVPLNISLIDLDKIHAEILTNRQSFLDRYDQPFPFTESQLVVYLCLSMIKASDHNVKLIGEKMLKLYCENEQKPDFLAPSSSSNGINSLHYIFNQIRKEINFFQLEQHSEIEPMIFSTKVVNRAKRFKYEDKTKHQGVIQMTKNVLYCDHCKRKGHSLENCRHLHKFCSNCQKTGHNTIECYRKPIDETPPWRKASSNKNDLPPWKTKNPSNKVLAIDNKPFNQSFQCSVSDKNKSSSSKSDASQAQKNPKKKQTKQVNQVIQLFPEHKRTLDDSPMRFDVYQDIEPTDEHFVTSVLDGYSHCFMIRAIKMIECQNSQRVHDIQKEFQSDKMKHKGCSIDDIQFSLSYQPKNSASGSLPDMADRQRTTRKGGSLGHIPRDETDKGLSPSVIIFSKQKQSKQKLEATGKNKFSSVQIDLSFDNKIKHEAGMPFMNKHDSGQKIPIKLIKQDYGNRSQIMLKNGPKTKVIFTIDSGNDEDDNFVPVTQNLAYLQQAVSRSEFEKMIDSDAFEHSQFTLTSKETQQLSGIMHSKRISKEMSKLQYTQGKQISFNESTKSTHNNCECNDDMYIDTGSSINVGPYQLNDGQLIEYQMIRESPIEFIAGFNNHKERVLFVADKTIQIPSTRGIITLVLRGIYVVQTSVSFLLSVMELNEQGFGFQFNSDENPFMTLPDDTRVALVREKSKRLFLLPYIKQSGIPSITKKAEVQVSTPMHQCNRGQLKQFKVVKDMKQLHEMWGHPNFRLLHKMLQAGDIDVVLQNSTYTPICDVCNDNKAHRNTISIENQTQVQPYKAGEYLVMDVKGKLTTCMFQNSYWLLIICAISQFEFFFPLQNKMKIVTYLHKVFNYMKVRGIKVRAIKSDNGSEFKNSEMMKFCNDNGIEQLFCPPHSQAKNGLVERHHRTYVTAIRCLLGTYTLPDKFWSLAGKYYNLISNRLWHSALKYTTETGEIIERSPFFVLNGYLPSHKMMRTFGEPGTVFITDTSNFQPTGEDVIFVGVAGDDTYLLWNLTKSKLQESFHVTFRDASKSTKEVIIDPLRKKIFYDESMIQKMRKEVQRKKGLLQLQDSTLVDETLIPTCEQQIMSSPGESPPGELKRKSDLITSPLCSQENSIVTIPIRNQPIKVPIEYTEEMKKFLKIAHSKDLLIRCQSKNPKLSGSLSHARWEKSKYSQNIKGFLAAGSTWQDFVHAYLRGYIVFQDITDPIVDIVPNTVALTIFSQSFDLNNDVTSSKDLGTLHLIVEQKDFISCLTSIQSPSTELLPCSIQDRIIKKSVKNSDTKSGPLETLWKASKEKEWYQKVRPGMELVTYDIFRATENGKIVSGLWVHTQTTVIPEKMLHKATEVVPTPDNTTTKSRYVANGSTQRPVIDYDQTFAGVFSYNTFRLLLQIAVQRELKIVTFDLERAFLQNTLDRTNLFMTCPKDIGETDAQGRPQIFRATKGQYGLTQSGHLLYKNVIKFADEKGFKKFVTDPCTFTRFTGKHTEYLSVYVDDIIFLSPSVVSSQQFEVELRQRFTLNEQKSIQSESKRQIILGAQLDRNWENGYLIMSNGTYIQGMTERFGLEKCPKTLSPISPGTILRKAQPNEIVDNEIYRQKVGSLMFLSTTCRPDIAQATGQLTKYFEKPSQQHVDAADKVIAYLYHSKKLGIKFQKVGQGVRTMFNGTPDNEINAFCDASHQSDPDTFRSVNGGLILWHMTPIAWWSKISRTHSTSTAESELCSAVELIKALMMFRLMLEEAQYKQLYPTEVFEDNSATISFAELYQGVRKVKHYLSRVAFVQEQHESGIFKFTQVGTKNQLADALTKPLPISQYKDFVEKIQMINAPN